MAKKIEGWSRDTDISPSGRIVVRLLGESDYQCRAVTVAVHDGKHERVFTESEVRAMVREMVEGVAAGEELTLETIAAKHGVLLDPA